MMRVYDQLKKIEQDLKVAYKNGCKISCTIFRDIELYERYQEMKGGKMDRYTILSDDYRLSVGVVRGIIYQLSKKI